CRCSSQNAKTSTSDSAREWERFAREEIEQLAPGDDAPRIAGRLVAGEAQRQERLIPWHMRLQPPDRVATQSLEIDGRRQRRSCDETVVLKRAHRERRAEGVEDTASHRWPLTRQRACQI